MMKKRKKGKIKKRKKENVKKKTFNIYSWYNHYFLIYFEQLSQFVATTVARE
jgi:hypothetical protein